MTYYVKAGYTHHLLPKPIASFRTEAEAREFLHRHKSLHKFKWDGRVWYEITAGLNDIIHCEEHLYRKGIY